MRVGPTGSTRRSPGWPRTSAGHGQKEGKVRWSSGGGDVWKAAGVGLGADPGPATAEDPYDVPSVKETAVGCEEGVLTSGMIPHVARAGKIPPEVLAVLICSLNMSESDMI